MVSHPAFAVRSTARTSLLATFILALTIFRPALAQTQDAPFVPVPATPYVTTAVCAGNDPRDQLCALLTGDATTRLPLDADLLTDLRDFYGARNYAPAWNGPDGAEQARAALGVLASADADGLDPIDYRPPIASSAPSTVENDILLTASILRYARDLRLGRVPPSQRPEDVGLPIQYYSFGRDLESALEHGGVTQYLAAQRPANPEYTRLAEALARYRQDGQSEKADTIMANMERWRWMPRPLESRYIMANEAAADLKVVDGDQVILTSRVIAGKPSMPSPILRAEARGIIVNPPWNVPANIARREILPKVRRNPHYLAAHGFVWRDGQIQQRAGAHSALGRVKLDMPNDFSVYLHDTPGKALFASDKRNLSHGCIRVQEIVPLASVVLTGQADEDGEERVRDAIAQGATRWITAPVAIAVYFSYWTAVPDADGDVQFFPDVYGRDARLLALLRRSSTTRVSLETER